MVNDATRIGAPLSPAELETLRHLSAGLPQKDVAAERGVSIQTVKNQLSTIYYKLQVSSLVEAFYVMGWLRPFALEPEHELRMFSLDVDRLQARLDQIRASIEAA